MKYKGDICILICGFLWGTINLFTLPLNELAFDSLNITYVRSLMSMIALGVIIFFYNKKLFKIDLKDILLFIVLGTISFYFVCVFYTKSIQLNGSSVAAMLDYTSLIWTVLFARFLFKEKITLIKAVSLIGILFGCLLLSFGGEININLSGFGIGIITGILLSSYSVLAKILSKKYDGLTIVFYAFLFASIGGFFIRGGWNIPKRIIEKPISLKYFLLLSILSTALPYFLYNVGLKTVPVGKACMLTTIEIVVASFCGLLFYDKNPGIIGFIGIALTIFFIFCVQLSDKNLGKKDL